MVKIACLWTAAQIDELYADVTFPICTVHYLTFVSKGPTDQTSRPICTHNVSNDTVWQKKGPFVGLQFFQISIRDQKPLFLAKKPIFPAKLITSNHFLTVRDTRNISTGHLYKIEATNGIATSYTIQSTSQLPKLTFHY